MDIVARAQSILLKPKEEWSKIKAEPTSIQQLFIPYAAILAAIPVVAQFLGWALIGFRIPFVGGSWMGRAILYLIFSYVFGLVAVYVFGVIINALAPNFSSTQNLPSAMKLAVYSMTPAWLAGIFHIIPSIGFLAVLGFLYGIYILYLGFATPLMETPKEKVVGYMIVSVVVMIVLWAVIGLILGAIFAMRGLVSLF
ncbi:MAG: Yip1 family protein [Candidatus Aminicenantales bacterium]